MLLSLFRTETRHEVVMEGKGRVRNLGLILSVKTRFLIPQIKGAVAVFEMAISGVFEATSNSLLNFVFGLRLTLRK